MYFSLKKCRCHHVQHATGFFLLTTPSALLYLLTRGSGRSRLPGPRASQSAPSGDPQLPPLLTHYQWVHRQAEGQKGQTVKSQPQSPTFWAWGPLCRALARGLTLPARHLHPLGGLTDTQGRAASHQTPCCPGRNFLIRGHWLLPTASAPLELPGLRGPGQEPLGRQTSDLTASARQGEGARRLADGGPSERPRSLLPESGPAQKEIMA